MKKPRQTFTEADLLSAGATVCYIYTLHASNDPECRPRYVGLTRQPKGRSGSHNFGKPHGRKGVWVREVRKTGGKVILTIIFEFRSDNLSECGAVEGGFINSYRQKYPDLLNDAGAGAGICTASDKTKALISRSSKGRRWPEEARKRISMLRRGKPLSEEHCEAISNGSRGKKLTQAHIEHNRIARLGILHSDETKKKIGDWSRGKKKSPETIRRMKQAWEKRKTQKLLDEY